MPDYTPPALQLYKGQTRHSRFTPFEQSFSYKLFLIDIDIDRLDEANTISALFNIDKPGLFSFRRSDHGYRKNIPLRGWAEDMFATAGIDMEAGRIRLVTLPRHLFYKFAPISLWFGYGPNGALRGVIYEVNNTFGDTHAYVAPVSEGLNQHEANKQLYVSPFFDVSGQYRFTLRSPDARLSMVVDNYVDGQRTHMANIIAKAAPASSTEFLKAAISRPFSTFGVTLGIHFEALKLWLRKAGYRSRPSAPLRPTTIATSLTGSGSQEENKSR